MKTKRKIISVALGLMLTASLLGGCGKGSGSNALDFSNATLSGIIASVDDDKVTISMSGGFGGGRMGNFSNRMQDDEQSADNNDTESSGEERQTPPDMANGEMPEGVEGQRPNRENFANGGFGGNMMQGNNTFTLTITDESLLEDCTMSDVVEGSFITITMGDNNSVSSISVMKLTNTDNQSTSDTPEEGSAL